MRRILLFCMSATITLPEVSTATPAGLVKSAAVPTPFVKPGVKPDELPPTSVMTVRLGEMRRILLLPLSATITLPEVSTATQLGALKSAAVPTPLVKPPVVPDELPPASVMTRPAAAAAERDLGGSYRGGSASHDTQQLTGSCRHLTPET